MRAVTTTSGRSSSPLSRRQKSTKASQKLSRSVSSTRKLHEPLAGRRNLASSSRKRDSATTSATGATADSPVDVPQRKQASVAEAADTSEALRRQLEDLRALLLRVTGNDEARSTRLVAFASHAGGSTEEQAWVERLDRSIARMDTRGERRTRVAVLGDSPEDLARFSLALLEDPLASDTSAAQTLRARICTFPGLSGKDNETLIASGRRGQEGASLLALHNDWLASHQIELVEINASPSGRTLSSQTWSSVLASDITIVLSPPSDKADLARLSRKPNTIFASPTAPDIPNKLLAPATTSSSIDRISKDAISPPLQSMVVNPDLAIQANSILSQSQPYSGGAASSSEDFSSLFLRSGIPQLREVIEGLVTGPSSSSGVDSKSSFGERLLAQTLLHLAAALLLDLSSALAEARAILHTAAGELGQLDLRAARDKRHSEIELGFMDLGKLDLDLLVTDNPSKPESGLPKDTAAAQIKAAAAEHKPTVREVVDSLDAKEVEDIRLLEDGQRDVARALNAKRLRWYKLPFGRADDIATDLSNALSGYFADLERKLIFETGRLSERSLALSQLVNSYFKGSSAFATRPRDEPSLFSATIQNQLVSLSPTTQFGFPPPSHPSPLNVRQTSLTLPITARKAQLASAGGPIEKLQIRAQSAAMQFYSISGGSIATAIFLSQTPMQELAVDVPTSVGIGLLGTVLAGWRLQGAWRRSKERFWVDWKRAQEGLSYDLQANARSVLDDKIFVKADTARIVLRKQLDARQQALQGFEQSLRKAQGELSTLRSRS